MIVVLFNKVMICHPGPLSSWLCPSYAQSICLFLKCMGQEQALLSNGTLGSWSRLHLFATLTSLLKRGELSFPLWCPGFRIWHCHCISLGRCCGVGSIPGSSTCCGCGKKNISSKTGGLSKLPEAGDAASACSIPAASCRLSGSR